MQNQFSMEINAIKTDADYKKSLKRVDELWEASPNTQEGDELEVLVTLIEAYEEKHHPIYPPDPVEAIKFYMDQMGLRKVDIAKYLGGKNRVTEVLQRKRKLSLKMIKALHNDLGIPAESLLS
jgi:HTH-type transcriptional regulator / antitoxin HigA